MKQPVIRLLVVILASNWLTACTSTPAGSASNQMFEDYWEYRMQRHPARATYLGDHRYDDQLFDYSEAARREELARYQKWLRQSERALADDALEARERLNLELFALMLKDRIELAEYPEHLMPIKQQNSPQIAWGELKATHPFKTAADYDNYAVRMRRIGPQVDHLIARLNTGVERGVIRPKIITLAALEQFDALVQEDPRECALFPPAATQSAGGEATMRSMEPAVAEAITAIARLRDYLRETYLPGCRDTLGYSELPDGKAWYRRLAKHHTTTDLTPEAIHEIGLKELKRIHAEMLEIARGLGHRGRLPDFIKTMREDPANFNKTPEEMMRRHREILTRSDASLPKLFGVLPKTPYDLKAIEPFRAAGAPAGYYYNAPDDGSRPAYFYVNTYLPETRPIYTMEALAYHEAMPGHHLQLAIAQEKKGLPKFRRFEHITAFIEGWALYSELLGYDLGGYLDPGSRFGQLTFDSWRSSRLVVDTGIHYFGWSRERAINFMLENTGLSRLDIESEIDRYIAWPGQALAYKIGQLEIMKLRQEAEQRLGDQFDIRGFHDDLLAEGSLPLSMVGKRMADWIAAREE